MFDVPLGSVWTLPSRRRIEVEHSIRKDHFACFYVDDLGRPIAPADKNKVTLSFDFLDKYARRVWHG